MVRLLVFYQKHTVLLALLMAQPRPFLKLSCTFSVLRKLNRLRILQQDACINVHAAAALLRPGGTHYSLLVLYTQSFRGRETLFEIRAARWLCETLRLVWLVNTLEGVCPVEVGNAPFW